MVMMVTEDLRQSNERSSGSSQNENASSQNRHRNLAPTHAENLKLVAGTSAMFVASDGLTGVASRRRHIREESRERHYHRHSEKAVIRKRGEILEAGDGEVALEENNFHAVSSDAREEKMRHVRGAGEVFVLDAPRRSSSKKQNSDIYSDDVSELKSVGERRGPRMAREEKGDGKADVASAPDMGGRNSSAINAQRGVVNVQAVNRVSSGSNNVRESSHMSNGVIHRVRSTGLQHNGQSNFEMPTGNTSSGLQYNVNYQSKEKAVHVGSHDRDNEIVNGDLQFHKKINDTAAKNRLQCDGLPTSTRDAMPLSAVQTGDNTNISSDLSNNKNEQSRGGNKKVNTSHINANKNRFTPKQPSSSHAKPNPTIPLSLNEPSDGQRQQARGGDGSDFAASTRRSQQRRSLSSSLKPSSQLRGVHRSTSPSRHSLRELAFLQSVRKNMFAVERQKLEGIPGGVLAAVAAVSDADRVANKSIIDKGNAVERTSTAKPTTISISNKENSCRRHTRPSSPTGGGLVTQITVIDSSSASAANSETLDFQPNTLQQSNDPRKSKSKATTANDATLASPLKTTIRTESSHKLLEDTTLAPIEFDEPFVSSAGRSAAKQVCIDSHLFGVQTSSGRSARRNTPQDCNASDAGSAVESVRSASHVQSRNTVDLRHRRSRDNGPNSFTARTTNSNNAVDNNASYSVSSAVSTSGLPLTEADRKLYLFRQAEKLGKGVCVCGASSFYERENIRLTKEKSRLKQESEQVKEQSQKINKDRQEIASTNLLLENRAAELESQEKRNQRRCDALQLEIESVERSREELAKLKKQMASELENAAQREQEFERKLKKLERDQKHLEEESRRNSEENQKLLNQWVKIKRTQSQIQDDQEKITRATFEAEARTKALDETEGSLRSRQDELERFEIELNKENRKLAETREELQEVEEKTKMDIEKAERLNMINLEMDKNLTKKQAALDSMRDEVQNHGQELEETKKKLEKARQDFDKWKEETENKVKDWKLKVENDWSGEKQKQSRKLQDYIDEQKKYNDTLLEKRRKEWQQSTSQLKAEAAKNEQDAEQNEKTRKDLSEERSHLDKQHLDFKEYSTKKEEYLQQRENHLAQQMEKLEERSNSLDSRKIEIQAIDQDLNTRTRSLNSKVQDFNAFEVKLNKQAESQSKREEELGSQLTAINQKLEELDKQSEELATREHLLTSKEAQAKWMHNVYADANDLKEKYELQLSELNWEKQTLESLRQNFESAKKRHAEKICQRDEMFAAKEKALLTREKDINRIEKLVLSRVDNFNANASTSNSFNRRLMTIRPSTVSLTSAEQQPTTSSSPRIASTVKAGSQANRVSTNSTAGGSSGGGSVATSSTRPGRSSLPHSARNQPRSVSSVGTTNNKKSKLTTASAKRLNTISTETAADFEIPLGCLASRLETITLDVLSSRRSKDGDDGTAVASAFSADTSRLPYNDRCDGPENSQKTIRGGGTASPHFTSLSDSGGAAISHFTNSNSHRNTEGNTSKFKSQLDENSIEAVFNVRPNRLPVTYRHVQEPMHVERRYSENLESVKHYFGRDGGNTTERTSNDEVAKIIEESDNNSGAKLIERIDDVPPGRGDSGGCFSGRQISVKSHSSSSESLMNRRSLSLSGDSTSSLGCFVVKGPDADFINVDNENANDCNDDSDIVVEGGDQMSNQMSSTTFSLSDD